MVRAKFAISTDLSSAVTTVFRVIVQLSAIVFIIGRDIQVLQQRLHCNSFFADA